MIWSVPVIFEAPDAESARKLAARLDHAVTERAIVLHGAYVEVESLARRAPMVQIEDDDGG